MRRVRTVLLAGAVVVGVAGLAGLALAAVPQIHEMAIRLPGGGVERIQYTGNVQPKVVFVGAPAFPVASFGFWGAASPFADIDRISALMDRQMDAMFRETQAMQQVVLSGGLDQAVLKDVPRGTSSYSMVTTISGNGFCSRSMQVTSSPDGGKPKVVSHSSGNCGSAAAMTAPSVSSSSRATGAVRTISLKMTRAAAPDGRRI